MSKWKYFSDVETQGMANDVCFRLDRARELFGNPIILTCGYRTPERQMELNPSVPDSAHCKGLAADIQAPVDSAMREKLMWALGASGFMRVESAPRHFHVDTDNDTKPSPCWWEGDDK